ncbi:succinate dehydrogenase, hydrophobic membrane anchor protein [Pelagibacterium limicola]|uniref:succinate dehydrogenase, hydrophobic membrane anchor protein n=1 Tax=Pelagibacterium limicola TaxID=2791022 RepID=UPI0018AF800C|nr:succinate dehydrogenase, hydrophobic membrane anchor protein [Pelagibacterium limicola]
MAHSGNKGTATFIRQRITGALNIPLIGFFIWLIVSLQGANRAQMVATFSNPIVYILALVLIGSALTHMRIGMNEIIEDYVHAPALHNLAKLANTVFTIAIGAVAVIAVLVLAFGG